MTLTRQAILDTQELLVTLALLVLIGILGAALVDQWTWRISAEPDLQMSQAFMLDCLNSGNGRAIKVGREAVVICTETE